MNYASLLTGRMQSPISRVTTNAPALVRITAALTAAGVRVLEPITDFALFVSAYPDNTSPGALPGLQRWLYTYRNAGNYVYLPFAGDWMLETAFPAGVGQYEYELLYQVPTDIAGQAMAGLFPGWALQGNTIVPAGGLVNIFGGALTALNLPLFLSVAHIRYTNQTAASTLNVAIGAAATAAIGHPINANITQTRTWIELGGRNVTVFNPGAAPVTMYWEASFAG